MYFNLVLVLCLVVETNAHVFIGRPAPFKWNLDITKLIMPMNGDPNYQGPEWGQQPFPCKGYHKDATYPEPQTTWYAGGNVTFQ
jgi:hypothetical protein